MDKDKTKQNEKSKYVYMVYAVFFIIIFSLIILVYLKIANFKNNLTVTNVNIIGTNSKLKNYLEKDLDQIKGHKIKDINIKEIQKYVLSLPWFNNVSVSREYPSTITISVIEKNPLYIWQDDNGKFYIINSENKVLRSANLEDYKNLILIESGKASLNNLDEIKFLIYKDYSLLNSIEKLVYNGYRWDIVLKNGIVIKLPETGLEKAINMILKFNKEKSLLQRDIDYIDARVSEKLIILPHAQVN